MNFTFIILKYNKWEYYVQNLKSLNYNQLRPMQIQGLNIYRKRKHKMKNNRSMNKKQLHSLWIKEQFNRREHSKIII